MVAPVMEADREEKRAGHGLGVAFLIIVFLGKKLLRLFQIELVHEYLGPVDLEGLYSCHGVFEQFFLGSFRGQIIACAIATPRDRFPNIIIGEPKMAAFTEEQID